MLRALRRGWIVILLLPAGCTRDEDYLEVFRAQQANWKETADILATITDEKSMANAKASLEERSKNFEAISQKANALPKPPPASVLKRLEEDRFVMERSVQRLQDEVKRVRELPGGAEFLKQFESRSPGLLSSVKR